MTLRRSTQPIQAAPKLPPEPSPKPLMTWVRSPADRVVSGDLVRTQYSLIDIRKRVDRFVVVTSLRDLAIFLACSGTQHMIF